MVLVAKYEQKNLSWYTEMRKPYCKLQIDFYVCDGTGVNTNVDAEATFCSRIKRALLSPLCLWQFFEYQLYVIFIHHGYIHIIYCIARSMFSFLKYFRHSFNCISPDRSVCPQPDSLAWWLGGWDRSPWMAHGTMAPASFLPPNPPTETPQLPPALRPATSATNSANIATNIATNIVSNLATKTNTANTIITANRHAKASEMPVSKRRKRMKDVNGFLLHTILISVCLLRSTYGGFFMFSSSAFWKTVSLIPDFIPTLTDWLTYGHFCMCSAWRCWYSCVETSKPRDYIKLLIPNIIFTLEGWLLSIYVLSPWTFVSVSNGQDFDSQTILLPIFLSALHFKRIAQLQTRS